MLAALGLKAGVAPQFDAGTVAQARMALVKCMQVEKGQPTRAALTSEVRQLGVRFASPALAVDDAYDHAAEYL